MGAVRRAFGSLLALGARHAGGPASGDVAPRLGTRLASLRAVHTRGDYLGSMGAPIVGGSLPGGMGNPSRLDRVPRERRRVYNARAWAVTSDHWRGLATVAGEDDDGGDGAGLAPDDSDDEAPPADADEEEDIAAFHDSLDDDTDDASVHGGIRPVPRSTTARDPTNRHRPRRRAMPARSTPRSRRRLPRRLRRRRRGARAEEDGDERDIPRRYRRRVDTIRRLDRYAGRGYRSRRQRRRIGVIIVIIIKFIVFFLSRARGWSS